MNHSQAFVGLASVNTYAINDCRETVSVFLLCVSILEYEPTLTIS